MSLKRSPKLLMFRSKQQFPPKTLETKFSAAVKEYNQLIFFASIGKVSASLEYGTINSVMSSFLNPYALVPAPSVVA